MSQDEQKYNQALAYQQMRNDPCTVVKQLWTPHHIEVTRRDGKVFYFSHDQSYWPVLEVKK